MSSPKGDVKHPFHKRGPFCSTEEAVLCVESGELIFGVVAEDCTGTLSGQDSTGTMSDQDSAGNELPTHSKIKFIAAAPECHREKSTEHPEQVQ